jgi:hypothetical protein
MAGHYDPLADPANRCDQDDDLGTQMDRAYDLTPYKNGEPA